MKIVWDESYSVGIGEIDEQHKQLIGLFNEVHAAIDANAARSNLGNVIEDLIDYTRVHFVTEERILKTHSYQNFERHKLIHDNLTIRAIDLQERFLEENSIPVLIESMKLLTDWLTGHILVTDKEYAPFLISKGVK